MKIVYFGSGAFGLPTIERLAGEHELVGVVTQPDRPAGRKRRLTPTPIGRWVSEQAPALAIFKPQNVNEPAMVEQIRSLATDTWVVIAFGQKLSPRLLADRFAINLHASLLPRWRGAAPINHAILAGDAQTGNSVITLADRMDAGLVLGQSRRAIEPQWTAGELHDLLAADGPELVMDVLQKMTCGDLKPIEQDESAVTIAGKLSKADGWVDFSQTAEQCRRRIHGLTPWPGVTVSINHEPVKILRTQTIDASSEQEPGDFVSARQGVVQCAASSQLQLLEVQPAGKRAMAWSDYVRGHDLTDGDRIEGRTSC